MVSTILQRSRLLHQRFDAVIRKLYAISLGSEITKVEMLGSDSPLPIGLLRGYGDDEGVGGALDSC